MQFAAHQPAVNRGRAAVNSNIVVHYRVTLAGVPRARLILHFPYQRVFGRIANVVAQPYGSRYGLRGSIRYRVIHCLPCGVQLYAD